MGAQGELAPEPAVNQLKTSTGRFVSQLVEGDELDERVGMLDCGVRGQFVLARFVIAKSLVAEIEQHTGPTGILDISPACQRPVEVFWPGRPTQRACRIVNVPDGVTSAMLRAGLETGGMQVVRCCAPPSGAGVPRRGAVEVVLRLGPTKEPPGSLTVSVGGTKHVMRVDMLSALPALPPARATAGAPAPPRPAASPGDAAPAPRSYAAAASGATGSVRPRLRVVTRRPSAPPAATDSSTAPASGDAPPAAESATDTEAPAKRLRPHVSPPRSPQRPRSPAARELEGVHPLLLLTANPYEALSTDAAMPDGVEGGDDQRVTQQHADAVDGASEQRDQSVAGTTMPHIDSQQEQPDPVAGQVPGAAADATAA